MVHTHLKTRESSRYGNRHKEKNKDGTNPISSWMMFQTNTKKFTEGNKVWKLPHMDTPQQSTIVKAFDSHHCNSLRTHGPGKKNLQSTKHVKPEREVQADINFYLDAETVKTHDLCANIISLNLKRKGFSDRTGALPHNSSRGN